MSNYFDHTNLMAPPNKRAAYSDRTSYLMAEMSRLAYFKFEGGSNIDELVEQITKLLPVGTNTTAILQLIKSSMTPHTAQEGRALLEAILAAQGFNLIDVYNEPSTGAQGFLCVHEKNNMVILAFRGTEPNLKDIMADIALTLTEVTHDDSTFLIHSGYLRQFRSIEKKIKADLNDAVLKDKQIFITGHSLGGALAITAVKFLARNVNGACYTFGSPPVGTVGFDGNIKTPIYRIINHVDIVPRLPSPFIVIGVRALLIGIGLFIRQFGGLFELVKNSKWYKAKSQMVLDAEKYRHSGYGSFLIGDGADAELRLSVGAYDRLSWWFKKFTYLHNGQAKFLSDHGIEGYARKLATWAETRQ